ncbi:MAG: alanine--tRNA ligase-related protein [Ignavibacteriaceae bacterium]
MDRTPFYTEAGGQVDDTGNIQINSKDYNVLDLIKVENNIVHVLQREVENIFTKNKPVVAEIDELRRWDIMRNHTATHFLHSALRNILGTHVQQAGSYVGPDHLRFDFTHYSKLTPELINEIETLVNDELRKNYALQHYRNIPFDEAKNMYLKL